MIERLQMLVDEAKAELERPYVMSPHYRKPVVEMADAFLKLHVLLDQWLSAHSEFVNDENDDISGLKERHEIEVRMTLLSEWQSMRSKFK